MDIRLTGTGGSGGWPQPGCRCASCARARSAGRSRSPAQLLVDGALVLEPGAGTGADGPPGGYRVVRIPGGWDVTSPGGARLLAADGSANTPEPPAGARPYDLALLDLLGDPAQ